MGWVESPNFFCDLSDMLKDAANAIVDTFLPVPRYSAITKIPKTGPVPPHTLESLTYIDCYVDDIFTAVQVGP